MECFIKKIFEGKRDNWTHSQFQKFSKGEFNDRAMIRAKNSSGKYTIDTTAEYAKELVCTMAERLGAGKTHIKGALISALDLQGFKYEDRKMAMGIRKYIIDREMTGSEIIDICKNVQKAFFGLSFGFGNDELTIKDKSPKSAKGVSSAKKEDADLKIDFCRLKTSDKKLFEELLFDTEIGNFNFKKVEIKHNFIITDIIIPPELKDEKDFVKVREGALRKGKIIREIDIDGKKIKKEKEFEA